MLMRMKTIKYFIFLFSISIILISINPAQATTFPSNGVIHWKGLDWYVYTGRSDPGNNYWNNQGVWVDNQNRLHLTVRNKDGKWYCTGLETINKYTYGTFTWTVASPVYTFDKNSVLGLFTYQDDNHELDIEPSRWGLEDDTNLGYSVQPYKVKGNERAFNVKGTNGANTTYKIEWKPYRIRFSSMQNGKIVNKWNYIRASGIPRAPAYACMNLWLIKPPSNGKNIDCIISDFSYTPYKNVLDNLHINTKSIQETSLIGNITSIDFWI
jgi:endo-1,3-1,4-beta-glycanase ExoK